MSYAEYLKSEHWGRARRAALEYADYRCVLCNSSKHLEVHHNTYERIGTEAPRDLVVLCADCHARHHHVMPSPPKHVDKSLYERRGAIVAIGRMLLESLLIRPEFISRAREVMNPNDFPTENQAELAALLWDDGGLDLVGLSERCSSEGAREIVERVIGQRSHPPNMLAIFEGCVGRMKELRDKEERRRKAVEGVEKAIEETNSATTKTQSGTQ